MWIRLFAVAAVLLLVVSGLAAPGSPLWLGVWKLNLTKSEFNSGPPNFKRVTMTVEPWLDGLRVIYDVVGLRGGVTHTEWSGRLDGRDYPVQGSDVVLTNAYTRVDDRTVDIATKVEGRIEGTARLTVSADGKSISILTVIKNQKGEVRNTTVYEKRPD